MTDGGAVLMPTHVLIETFAKYVDRELAAQLATDALDALHDAGYRVTVATTDDPAPSQILADALVRRLRIAAVAARGASGWLLRDLEAEGWKLIQVDPR